MFDAFFQGGDLAEPGAVLRLDKTFLGRCPENVRFRESLASPDAGGRGGAFNIGRATAYRYLQTAFPQ